MSKKTNLVNKKNTKYKMQKYKIIKYKKAGV
jgi:hypothetical protein